MSIEHETYPTVITQDADPLQLQPLFDRAEANNLWFHCPSLGVWLSPHELREEQRHGLFQIHARHWRLSDPREHELQLRKELERAEQHLSSFLERVRASAPVQEAGGVVS